MELNLFVIFSYLVTFGCGWLNVEVLMNFAPYCATHQTGHLTRIAVSLIQGDIFLFLGLLIAVGLFLAGSVVAGFVNPKGDMNFTVRFGVMYVIFSAGLMAFAVFLPGSFFLIMYCSFFSGYLNGFLTQFKIRVSHMSGIVSDAGIELGRLLKVASRKDRNKRTSMRALGLSFSMKMMSLGVFVAGALVGTVFNFAMPMLADFALLAAFNAAVAVFYIKISRAMREYMGKRNEAVR